MSNEQTKSANTEFKEGGAIMNQTIKTLRLATCEMEIAALEQENQEALKCVNDARQTLDSLEKDFEELAKLGIVL